MFVVLLHIDKTVKICPETIEYNRVEGLGQIYAIQYE